MSTSSEVNGEQPTETPPLPERTGAPLNSLEKPNLDTANSDEDAEFPFEDFSPAIEKICEDHPYLHY